MRSRRRCGLPLLCTRLVSGACPAPRPELDSVRLAGLEVQARVADAAVGHAQRRKVVVEREAQRRARRKGGVARHLRRFGRAVDPERVPPGDALRAGIKTGTVDHLRVEAARRLRKAVVVMAAHDVFVDLRLHDVRGVHEEGRAARGGRQQREREEEGQSRSHGPNSRLGARWVRLSTRATRHFVNARVERVC